MKVLFFGMLRDITGCAAEEIDAPECATAGSILDEYSRRFPRLQDLSASIVTARNHQFCASATPAGEGDEIAFLPPVSGGATPAPSAYTHLIEDHPEGCIFALTRQPVDTGALTRRLLRGEDGAVVNFEGVVRNNTQGRSTLFLDYECYEPMAIKLLAAIGQEILTTHAVGRIAMVHRLGRMEIGETSVAVIVTAPHRKPAFEAALEGINRLKKLVPIWKKEHFTDGAVWVEGAWDDAVLKRGQ